MPSRHLGDHQCPPLRSYTITNMLARTLLFVALAVAAAHAGGVVVDLATPPKYDFAYAVQDPHTGDLKQRAESRIGELTKQEYSWGEKDRIVQLAKVDAHPVPVAVASHSIGSIGLGSVGIGGVGLGGIGLGGVGLGHVGLGSVGIGSVGIGHGGIVGIGGYGK